LVLFNKEYFTPYFQFAFFLGRVRMLSVFLLLLLNIRSVLSLCSHNTYLHPRAAGGEGEIKLPNFDYGTTRGPVNWHNIVPENKLCGTGRAQSPINIDRSILLEAAGLVTMDVPVQNVEFENLGTTVEVIIEGKSIINCRPFVLKQFHFHTPSEHRINGEHFPVEVHMVHAAEGRVEKMDILQQKYFDYLLPTCSPLMT
jgi:carbonic anhydrase